MLPTRIEKAYTAFFNATNKNDVLEEKTTIMIQLAASMAMGCYP
jgi:hypothetical protein